MITQIVEYTPNPHNPEAAKLIVQRAKDILGVIEGTRLQIGRAIPSERAVAVSNDKVYKMTSWKDAEAEKAYFSHPNLRRWCEFVLRGWMLEGSVADDPQSEFIDYILSGKEQRAWARNAAIPESEVVWESENIHRFTVEHDNAEPSA